MKDSGDDFVKLINNFCKKNLISEASLSVLLSSALMSMFTAKKVKYEVLRKYFEDILDVYKEKSKEWEKE